MVVATVALAHIAFDLTQPFIPLYIRDLGITDLADAAFWSGIIVGIGPLCGAMMGPLWGAMADRYGRKPMVLRAMLMIGLMQIAIAFVPDVYWLLGLRVIMGLFAIWWFGSNGLGMVIGAAMIINLVAAALAGIIIPLTLDWLGVDPAVASGVFVTTVTDVVGFFAFLGLAAWWLM